MIQELNKGEMFALKEYFERGDKYDAILLAKSGHVMLRTNGLVVYGYYDPTGKGEFNYEKSTRFTHDINKYPLPYVDDYSMKEEVLSKYREVFSDGAKRKFYEAQYVMNYLASGKAKNKKPAQESKTQVPKENITINKGDGNMMTMKELMNLAHTIRRGKVNAGEFEGVNYRQQMSICLKMAHKIDKERTNVNKERVATVDDEVATEKTIEKQQPQIKTKVSSAKGLVYARAIGDPKDFNDLRAEVVFYNSATQTEKVLMKLSANKNNLDMEFAKVVEKLVKAMPSGLVLANHGNRTLCAFGKVASLAESKQITLSARGTAEEILNQSLAV